MASFRYTALGPGGELQRGLMDAATAAEVVLRLQRQGSMPMRAEPAIRGSTLAAWLRLEPKAGRGLRKQEVADLIRELATMLGAGQDLDRALRYAEETAANARLGRAVTVLRDAVRDGSPLSAALAKYPASFTRLHVGLVRAGEAGGTLGPTLARMADLLDRQRSLAATVGSALVYPCLLLVAAFGSVALLLTQVLPQFVPMFEQSGAKLPPSTQFLIATGATVSSYGLHALLGVAVLAVAARELLPDCDTEELSRLLQQVHDGAMLSWAVYREGALERWMRREVEALLRPYLRKARARKRRGDDGMGIKLGSQGDNRDRKKGWTYR